MDLIKYNEIADDADFRRKSVWSAGRLNTNENFLSINLKRAHDAYDEKQEQKRLALLLNDIWDIEDE